MQAAILFSHVASSPQVGGQLLDSSRKGEDNTHHDHQSALSIRAQRVSGKSVRSAIWSNQAPQRRLRALGPKALMAEHEFLESGFSSQLEGKMPLLQGFPETARIEKTSAHLALWSSCRECKVGTMLH